VLECGEGSELAVHGLGLHPRDIIRSVEELAGGLLGETFERHGGVAGWNVEAAGAGFRGAERGREKQRGAHECAERDAGTRRKAAVRATAGRGETGHAGDEVNSPEGGVTEADGRRAQNC
jgi:hypothetical protein